MTSLLKHRLASLVLVKRTKCVKHTEVHKSMAQGAIVSLKWDAGSHLITLRIASHRIAIED